MYHCYSILCLSVYLPLLASYILSLLCVLFSIPLFELDGIPLAFLVGSYSDDELPQLFFFFFKHGKVLFFLHFSSTTFIYFFLPHIVLLVGSFSLLAPWIHHPTAFWPVEFLLKNALIVLWGFSCTRWSTFLLLLLEFSL